MSHNELWSEINCLISQFSYELKCLLLFLEELLRLRRMKAMTLIAMHHPRHDAHVHKLAHQSQTLRKPLIISAVRVELARPHERRWILLQYLVIDLARIQLVIVPLVFVVGCVELIKL